MHTALNSIHHISGILILVCLGGLVLIGLNKLAGKRK